MGEARYTIVFCVKYVKCQKAMEIVLMMMMMMMKLPVAAVAIKVMTTINRND